MDKLTKLTELVARGPYADLLTDRHRCEAELARLMADSPDPMIREIGQQLGTGAASLTQLATAPAYQPVIRQGLDRLSEWDVDATIAALGDADDEPDRTVSDGEPDRGAARERGRRPA